MFRVFAGEQRAIGEALRQLGARGQECTGYGAFLRPPTGWADAVTRTDSPWSTRRSPQPTHHLTDTIARARGGGCAVLRSGSSAQPPATHAPQGLPRPDDLWAASGFFRLEAIQHRSSSGSFGPLLRMCYRRDKLRSDLWDEDGDLDELDSKAWREPGAAIWRAKSIEGS